MTDSNQQSTGKQNHSSVTNRTQQGIAITLNVFKCLFKLPEAIRECNHMNPHAYMGSYLSWTLWDTKAPYCQTGSRDGYSGTSPLCSQPCPCPQAFLGHAGPEYIPTLPFWKHWILLHLFLSGSTYFTGSPSDGRAFPVSLACSLPGLGRI